jgi:hypothetical protein
MHFDCPVVLKSTQPRRAQSLAETVYKQELDQIRALLARFSSASLYKGVEMNYSLFAFFFSKRPVEHARAYTCIVFANNYKIFFTSFASVVWKLKIFIRHPLLSFVLTSNNLLFPSSKCNRAFYYIEDY